MRTKWDIRSKQGKRPNAGWKGLGALVARERGGRVPTTGLAGAWAYDVDLTFAKVLVWVLTDEGLTKQTSQAG